MKRVLVILTALLVVFAMLGCGNGTTKPPPNPPNPPGPSGSFTSDLCENGDLVIELKGNFQYGKGYQANYEETDLFKGNKIVAGDKYTLEISFKGSRDLTGDESYLKIGLVDQTSDNYWNPLTWNKDGDDEYQIETKDLKSGADTTDLTINFTALKTAGNADAHDNALNIQFENLVEKAASGDSATYSPNPVTLTFTKFVLTKKSSGTPPPAAIDLVLYDGTDWLADLGTVNVFNKYGNTNMEFTNSIDTTGFTKVYFQFTARSWYVGGSIEGNDVVGSSTWVQNEYWSGLELINANGDGADIFAGALTDNGSTVGALKKIAIGDEDQISTVVKIWME